MENKKTQSLKLTSDFKKLREAGKFHHINDWLALSYMKNQCGQDRYGWTISRKIGNAVTRNRFKRWGREFTRRLDSYGLDINVIFKARGKDFYKELSHSEFDKTFKRALHKIGSKT